jgi:hypothetical protein
LERSRQFLDEVDETESPTVEADLDMLEAKIDAGASSAITRHFSQCFNDSIDPKWTFRNGSPSSFAKGALVEKVSNLDQGSQG